MSKYEKFNSSTSKKVDRSSVEFIRDLDEIAQEGALRMYHAATKADYLSLMKEFADRYEHEYPRGVE
ncbi:MAG: hypothetical protein WBP42_14650, partial [Candidatus Zixiibacteriota bacterium]